MISRRTREEAILLCAVMASHPESYVTHMSVVAEQIGASDRGYHLAWCAISQSRWMSDAIAWGEAEATLQCGWIPKFRI